MLLYRVGLTGLLAISISMERNGISLRFSVSPDLPPGIGSLTLSYNVLRISETESGSVASAPPAAGQAL